MRRVSLVFVGLAELADLVDLASFPFSDGRTWSLENEEGGHGCDLECLLYLLHLVNVSIDKHVVGIVVCRDLCQVILDQLAGSAPLCRDLDKCLLGSVGGLHSCEECLQVCGVLEGHDYVFLLEVIIYIAADMP